METVWSIFFNVLLHGLLIGSMVFFLIALCSAAIRTENPGERLRRCLALFVGAMIVIGAQASGLSFAAFMGESLAAGRVTSASAAAVASIVPGLAGLGIGFFMVRTYRKNQIFAMRLLCFVGMLALASFIQVYAIVTSTNGIVIGAAAVPNLSFAAGVVMVFIFADERKNGPSMVTQAMSLWERRPGGKASGTKPPAAPSTPKTNTRDPFDF